MDLISKPLVSIITACYNESKYIEKLLESILSQTYNNIEMIIVDDGSTDETKEIIDRYIDVFHSSGLVLRYIYQDNAGQAAATNRALKLINGKYLCWIDGDDFLFSTSIEKRVDFLEKHPDYGMVTSDFYLLYQDENNRIEKKGSLYKNLNWQTNQFELTIAGESIIENLAQMVNVDLYRKINPSMDILENREGQNYQIILPILYFYKRGFIDEALGCYRIHNDSHCHQERSYDLQLARFDELITMLDNILRTIGIRDRERLHYIKSSTFYLEKGRYIDNGRA